MLSGKLNEVDVVILCGGKGSRLAGVVNDRPKSMATINQKPFLDILIQYFSGFGIRRFVLCAGYKSEVISDYYTAGKEPLEIVISDEPKALGTAGSVKNARKFIQSDPFIVANGDSFCSVDLVRFFEFHLAKKCLMSMAVVESENPTDCGLVSLHALNRIIKFDEKQQKQTHGYINAGIYLFQKDILSYIPADTKYSFEYELFPKLVEKNSYAFISSGKVFDIGTPERYELAKKYFSEDINTFVERESASKGQGRFTI